MGGPSWNTGGGTSYPFNIFTIGNEMQLQQLQIQQAKEEAEWNKLMRPILLKQMGLIQEGGILRPMTEEEKLAGMTEEEKSAYQTDQILAERQAKAAKGELGTPGYVENEISRQRGIQSNLLSQRLGAKGANVSTPGINAKADLMGNEAATRSAYAYGQEQQGMGLLSGYNNYLNNLRNQNISTYGNFANAGLNLIPQMQTANQPNTYGRQLGQEWDQMNEQRKTAAQTGLLSGIGTAASIYLTKGGSMGGGK